MSRFKAAGIMSGTSLDGLDIAFCEFEENDNRWKFRILHARTVVFENELFSRLTHSMKLPAHELAALHSDLGTFIGSECRRYMQETGFEPDLISSHGHTVFHQPEKGLTLQIGDGNIIAGITKKITVYDFRSGDVVLGGQGAPLVPMGDELLFSDHSCCLNLGGIANISFRKVGQRLAYDVTALNQVFNQLAQRAGRIYDEGGKIAASGKVDKKLLQQFDALEYYSLMYPKSLGKEWVDKEVIIKMNLPDTASLMRTWSEHAAARIGESINAVCSKNDKVLVTGGGAKNDLFLSILKEKTEATLVVPDEKLVDHKEAMVFAFLGLLRHLGRNNILSSVTGAKSDSSCGIIAKP